MDKIVYIVVGTIGAAMTPMLIVPTVHVVGFGVAGPVAASIAVGFQSGIGNVVAGSAFATAQAIGMGAAVPAGIYAAAAGLGGVTTMLGFEGLKVLL